MYTSTSLNQHIVNECHDEMRVYTAIRVHGMQKWGVCVCS